MFAGALDPASVVADGFRFVREPDKDVKEGALEPSPVARAVLVDARTVDVHLPNMAAETVAERTQPDGTVAVKPAISLSYSLRADDGRPIAQTVHATVNALP